MEIPAWLFFSFWSVTSITFLHLAFNALDQNPLSNSVSPLVSLLKHSLAISSCCSSSYALKCRPQQARSHYFLALYVILGVVFSTTTDGIILRGILVALFDQLLHLIIPLLPTLHFLWEIISKIPQYIQIIQCALLLYSLGGAILPIMYSLIKMGLLSLIILIVKFVSTVFSLQFLCYLPVFSIGLLWHLSVVFLRFSWILCVLLLDIILSCGTGDYYSTPEMKARVAILMVLEISLFFVSVENTKFSPILVIFVSHSISAILAALDERLAVKVKESKMRKFVIEFGVGIVGAIVFKNLFTLKQVEAFLYLAVMWLANLTLLGFPFDFGIFGFLVCNVVVGCVVSELGLTLAYGAAALLLIGLRLKLESLTLEYEGDQIQIQ